MAFERQILKEMKPDPEHNSDSGEWERWRNTMEILKKTGEMYYVNCFRVQNLIKLLKNELYFSIKADSQKKYLS